MTPFPARSFALAALALGGVALTGLGACAPITSYNGFQAVDNKPEEVKVGSDTRSTVLTKLGSPSAKATFDPNIWYYVSQTSEKMAYRNPEITTRKVVAISFDKDEKVTQVRQLGLGDGYALALNKRETPTRGRELSVIEQLLGNVGRGGLLPQDNDPGQRPGQGGGRGGR